jgi:hypothetical protein
MRDGFIIGAGSDKGKDFIEKHSQLFIDVPETLLTERDKNRAATQKRLEENNAEMRLDTSIKGIVENSWE